MLFWLPSGTIPRVCFCPQKGERTTESQGHTEDWFSFVFALKKKKKSGQGGELGGRLTVFGTRRSELCLTQVELSHGSRLCHRPWAPPPRGLHLRLGEILHGTVRALRPSPRYEGRAYLRHLVSPCYWQIPMPLGFGEFTIKKPHVLLFAIVLYDYLLFLLP